MKRAARFLCLFTFVLSVACQKASEDVRADSEIERRPSQPQTPGSAEPVPPADLPEPVPGPGEENGEAAPTGNAEQVAIPFPQVGSLGVGGVPAWPGDLEQLHRLVQEARNVRLYQNPNPGEYLRRAPWYHGDGCYAKAAHVSALAERSGFPRPGKVLAFGGWATMRYRSKYLPNGAIWWNYHVAAAYHIQSKVYVLDPLVSPTQALSVDEWVRAIAPRPEKIKVSFCDQNLYLPKNRCVGGKRDGAYLGGIQKLLEREYRDLKNEGYDPDTLL